MATREARPKRSEAAARGRQAPQRRKIPMIAILIGAAVVLAAVAFALLGLNGSGPVAPAAVAPGGPVAVMPTRDHVSDGERVQYTTNPPTSGNHSGNTATWGIYPSTPPSDERLVHNLEHGGVIISYNPAKVDDDTVERLKNLARDLRRQRTCLILTPRQSIQDDKAIALTAWGVLATLDGYDEAAIRAFWRDHVANGPELGKGVCG